MFADILLWGFLLGLAFLFGFVAGDLAARRRAAGPGHARRAPPR